VVRDATDKAHFRLRVAQCQTNERQRKVLERLLDAGHTGSGGGFLGGMTADKYAKLTNISKATATRDLTELLAYGLQCHFFAMRRHTSCEKHTFSVFSDCRAPQLHQTCGF
jgi:hypothetical protein